MKELGKHLARALLTPETAVLAAASLAALILWNSPLQAVLLGICALIAAALRFSRKAPLSPVRDLPEMKRCWLGGAVGAAVVLAACMLIFGCGWPETLSAALALLIALLPGGVDELTQHAARHTAKQLAGQGLRPRDASVPNQLALTSVLCAEQTGWLTAKPRVIAVAAPFEFTGAARFRRQNSVVLTATAMALTGDFCPRVGDALAAFAAPMGYEGARLRKRMMQAGEPVSLPGGVISVCYQEGRHLQMFLTGDAEQLLQLCDCVADAGERPLLPDEKSAWLDRLAQAREQGMLPVAFAMKQAEHVQDTAEHAVLLGVALVAEEPLPGVEDALRTCRTAGIRTVMFSEGDRESARLAARRLALLTPGERVVDGQDLARMDDLRLREEVRNISVCAGLTAAQKQRFIAAWQSWSATVLSAGTPLSCADLTVGGDADSSLHQEEPSLHALVTGVALARRMRSNQTVLTQYLAAAALGGGLTAALLGLTGAAAVFTPLSAALYGLIVRGVCALPLACNKDCRSVMRKPPQDADAALVDAPMVFRTVTQGVLLGLCAFGASLLAGAAFPALGLAAVLLMPANFSAVRTAFRSSLRHAWLRAGVGCITVAAASLTLLMLSGSMPPSWLKLVCGALLGILPLLATEGLKHLGCTGEKLRLTERKYK